MKRSQALIRLSREHHAALVLAHKAKRLAGGTNEITVQEFMRSLPQIFATELEPHFQIEERFLLPALRDAGADEAASRTMAEHEALRALLKQIQQGEVASLAGFGTLLAAHVRFEERELFGLAEALLPATTLSSVMSDHQNPA